MKKRRAGSLVREIADAYGDDKPRLRRELKRLIREGQRTGDLVLVGAAYYQLAVSCNDEGDSDGTLTNSLKAIALLTDTEEHELLARAYMTLGYAYSEQGNYQIELTNYEKAYSVIKKHRLKGDVRVSALNNLSTCYHMLGDYKTAIRLLAECMEYVREEAPDDYVSLAMFTLNLAEYHKDNGEPDISLAILEPMDEWIDKVEFEPLVCDYWLRLGVISYMLGDAEKGNDFTDKALLLVPGDCYPDPIYDDLRHASHYLSKNGDRERAEKILGLMETYSEQNDRTICQLFVLRTFADFYHSFGEFERAAEYYEKLDALNDRSMREMKGAQLNLHRRMHDSDSEIKKLKRKMQKREELYALEPMTGLLNRTALLKVSTEFIETAAKKRQKVGAIFIDIDFFKECNDTYGHAKGDEIIKEVANACKKEETASVRFARYGGDEFFGITCGLSTDEVAEVAKRICRTILEADIPNEKNPNGHRITLSAGVVNTAITDGTDTIIEIANHADKAVYHAKQNGKDSVYLLDYDKEGMKAKYVKIPFKE